MVYSFTYDTYGNPLTSKVGNSSLFTNSTATYTSNGNYTKTITNPSGNTVTYNYNETKGTLSSFVDAKGKTTYYSYDTMDRLTDVYKTVNGQEIRNTYSYVNDRLDTITHNGFNYKFNYDSLGNNTAVLVGNQPLITNTFEPRTGILKESTYGNGQKVSYDYDNLDRIIGKKYNGNTRYKYQYNAEGNIGYHEDLVNGVNYRYYYDLAERLSKITDSSNNEIGYEYDLDNNVSKLTDKINGNTFITNYSYDRDDRMKTVTANNNSTITYNYDLLSRLQSYIVNTGSYQYNTSLTYENGAHGANSTTNRLKSINNNGNTINYTYDANGNIETITQNGKLIKYYYNELNELVREDNQELGKTITYSYDIGGNILIKTEYNYITGVPSNPTSIYNYGYDEYNCMTWDASTSRWKGRYDYCIVGGNWQHPHVNESVRKWIAPASGNITISNNGTLHVNPGGDGVTLKLLKNNQVLWQQTLNPSVNQIANFQEINTNISEGDALYFIVGQYGNNAYDTVAWDPIITFTKTYQASVDFSSTQGKNSWHYMEKENGNYYNMTWDETNNRWRGIFAYCLIGDAWHHPNETESARKWVAPASGNVTITNANITRIYSSYDGVILKLFKNNELLWQETLIPNVNPITSFQSMNINVAEGDALYFVVNQNGNASGDTVSWDPSITFTRTYQASLDFSSIQGNNGWYYLEKNQSPVWKDKLTSINGKPIVYDAIGNPLSYKGWNYSWEEGRQLKSVNGNGFNISFKYNDSGIRTEKIVNGLVIKYHLVGDRVTYEKNGRDSIYYTYNPSGQLVSMNLNGVEYYYIRNGQGDIIGLFDGSGSQVVSYAYDTWGKLISVSGSLASTLGQKNPYRYRGYRYDTETGLYYLQSRYYNPEWGRFLNADTTEIFDYLTNTEDDLLDVNLFAYCLNNPVNMVDSDGDFAIGVAELGLIGIVILGVIVLTDIQYTMTPVNTTTDWPDIDGAIDNIKERIMEAKAKEGKKAKDSGKNEPHGDSGRALEKAKKQVEELEKELKNAVGKEAKKIKQKIKNIIDAAKKKQKGETHWN